MEKELTDSYRRNGLARGSHLLPWDEFSAAPQLARLGKQVSRAAQGRPRWLLSYFFNGRNAARTCRHFGISRQTFYHWKRRFDRHDLSTLEEHSHGPCRVRQPTRAPDLAERVLALRKQYPRRGKDKLVELLRRESARSPRPWSGACSRT